MGAFFRTWQHFFRETIWRPAPDRPWLACGYTGLQVIILACRELLHQGALLRTSSLAYASVLAIIPMLALLFAIFKGVGLQRLLAAYFLPQLAGGSQDFARQILTYVETTNVASLGIFGVIWLLVALMILMTNVEQAFNHIWKISRSRPWWRKLSDYLSIFLLLPILLAVAISLTSTFQSHPEIKKFISYFLPETFFSAYNLAISFGIVWLGFTLVYLVMPNTRVQFLSAVLGGLIGGTIWQGAQWLFLWFQGSAPYYNAIYGALYQILFLVIWMFWSWLIVLFGAEVAYTHQNLASLRRQVRGAGKPGIDVQDEYLALAALLVIGQQFASGGPPLSLRELAQVVNHQENLAAGSVAALQQCGLVVPVAGEAGAASPRFVPSRPPEQMRVQEILACLRRHRRQGVDGCGQESNPILCLVGELVERPAAQIRELNVQGLIDSLHRSEAGSEQSPPDVRCKPTQV